MKRMILVSSPPACGKTFISKQLAKNLKHVVYLDKDTLIPLSKQIFRVAKKPYDRSSDFFEENIRDYEYEVILNLAFEALSYDDTVLINAPFTREIRDVDYINRLRAQLDRVGARLTVIWVVTSPEICRQRMIKRNSDRDDYKIRHWDEYVRTVDFSVPTSLDDPDVKDDLLLFYNSSEAEYLKSMHDVLEVLESDRTE
ncbi:MAG: ATP-binding protein [Clostridiales bacterium]|nr:ATP-binding protein [Clostridiales bacterium]